LNVNNLLNTIELAKNQKRREEEKYGMIDWCDFIARSRSSDSQEHKLH